MNGQEFVQAALGAAEISLNPSQIKIPEPTERKCRR